MGLECHLLENAIKLIKNFLVPEFFYVFILGKNLPVRF